MITSTFRVNVKEENKKEEVVLPAPSVQVTDYEKMTKKELVDCLEQEMISYSKKDTKTKLIKLLIGE